MRFVQNLPRPLLLAGAALVLGIGAVTLAPAADKPLRLPPPASDSASPGGTKSVVLAGGCFWGLQGMFEHVKGIERVVAGYAGGKADTAHYEMVGGGETGHAESVRIDYDPAQISYGQILQLFFSTAHDPTEIDRQGPDDGTQYRSAIFVDNAEERQIAAAYIAQLTASAAFHRPIATKIEPLHGFYAAEGYHQDYLIHHPGSLYIVINDQPKIAALHRLYPELYREQPVTVGSDLDKS